MGAGRKPKGDRARAPHMRRAPLPCEFPVYLALEIECAVRDLRNDASLAAIADTLRGIQDRRMDFRVLACAVEGNRLHFVAESDTPGSFSSGARGLCIRVGKRLNGALGTRGRIFADRHERRSIRSPRDLRDVLAILKTPRARQLRGPAKQEAQTVIGRQLVRRLGV